MTTQLFEDLDRLTASPNPAAALHHLTATLLESGEYGLAFESRLMGKRHELGLPLIQSDQITRDDYQQAVMAIARDTGQLFLAAGNLARAWPYFRAIGETQPIEDAIAALPNEGDVEQVIGIAFQEGVHPLKGLELILANQGMCRAITAFGMTAVQKDREKCIALLARHLYNEIVPRMSETIRTHEGTAHEGNTQATTNLLELMQGRDWLFGEWDYYVDTSHLLSVVPYGIELKDPEALACIHELCEYGKHLAPQFQSAGVPPFENQFEAYGHYIQALRGIDTEAHLDYFRQQVANADPDVAGDAPGRTLTRLLIALGRPEEALSAVLDHVFEDAPWGQPVPTALQLCYQTGNFSKMQDLARERGDALSYIAAAILNRT
ncbi:MAG: hypothetical protein EBY17_15970 [Acidobacteriia bacterium]|nr:hypothetical protein [Terriglobia bacterium]